MERKAPTAVNIPAGSAEKCRRLGGQLLRPDRAKGVREELDSDSSWPGLVQPNKRNRRDRPNKPDRPERPERPDRPDSGYMLQCDQRTETEYRRPTTASLRSAVRLRWCRCSSRIGTVCIEWRKRDVLETLAAPVRRSFLVDSPVDVIGRHSVDVAIEDRESEHSPGRL